ncbi:MAG: hypothetical protein EPO42_00795 [Gallionellaceae bacterium]|nr:MAG: hypothetical protein EPO42_00795 [Gallionellaceae bacterium]
MATFLISCVVPILLPYRRCRMAKKMVEATRCRVRAGRMPLSGKGPTEVAAETGVGRQTVHTWKGALDEGGIDALRALGGTGRPVQLDVRQLETLRRSLPDPPTRTRLWHRTLDAQTGAVAYRTPVWRIMQRGACLAHSRCARLRQPKARPPRH